MNAILNSPVNASRPETFNSKVQTWRIRTDEETLCRTAIPPRCSQPSRLQLNPEINSTATNCNE